MRYSREFYGQSNTGAPHPDGISVDGLLRIIRSLPEGITELGCHPGDGNDFDSNYSAERIIECRTLCDAPVRAVIQANSVILCSFRDYAEGTVK
ncbi:MAG: hypothetical protein EXS36_10040 [Pedosphaera sp.]|nr:hypothetical protein [Pedosphaera sp.]